MELHCVCTVLLFCTLSIDLNPHRDLINLATVSSSHTSLSNSFSRRATHFFFVCTTVDDCHHLVAQARTLAAALCHKTTLYSLLVCHHGGLGSLPISSFSLLSLLSLYSLCSLSRFSHAPQSPPPPFFPRSLSFVTVPEHKFSARSAGVTPASASLR